MLPFIALISRHNLYNGDPRCGGCSDIYHLLPGVRTGVLTSHKPCVAAGSTSHGEQHRPPASPSQLSEHRGQSILYKKHIHVHCSKHLREQSFCCVPSKHIREQSFWKEQIFMWGSKVSLLFITCKSTVQSFLKRVKVMIVICSWPDTLMFGGWFPSMYIKKFC